MSKSMKSDPEPATSVRALVIEDNPGDVELIREYTRRETFVPISIVDVNRLSRGIEKIKEGGIDIILLDLNLPDSNGIETLIEVVSQAPDIPVVVLTGLDDEKVSLSALQSGAQDYLVKDNLNRDLLVRSIRYAIERKSSEQQLREKEARLSEAQRIARLGNWDWDLRTSKFWWSDEIYRIFGLEQNEVETTYRVMLSSVHRDDKKHVATMIDNAINMGTAYSIQHRIVLPDGTTKVVRHEAMTDLDERGKPLRLKGTIQDVTEQKRREEELLKTHKLESLGILAGGIAHDFNNLLTTIFGNISLAKLYAKENEKVYKMLLDMENASLRAKGLTQQLLTFAKGGVPIKGAASIGELVVGTTTFALRGSNVKCNFTLPQDLWVVEIDKGQISQVVSNIILNSCQAMQDGGTIDISAENVKLKKGPDNPLKDGSYVQISIRDSGVGIPQEYLHKIFDPYFSTKEEGSGLGLTISYSIVKRHDGHISVVSEEGAGTTFNIYLPMVMKKALSAEADTQDLIKGHGRVLIMDDEEFIRDVVGHMLAALEYEVEFATDGKQAIEFYERAKANGSGFDVVILDLTVPGGMGGKETVKRLIEIDPAVKTIASSGYSNDPVLAEYEQYGFRGAIAKPYDVNQLSEVLHEVLGSGD